MAMFVKDSMHTELSSVQKETSLLEAAEIMVALVVDTLLVLEQGKLVGVIGLRDLFTAPVPAHYGGGMAGRRDEDQLLDVWRTTPVKNLMNEQAITVTEDTPLIRAAELMVNTGRHPLPVLRDGIVVGAISRADVVRMLLARGRERHERPA
jgi:CBS domain-containing protein